MPAYFINRIQFSLSYLATFACLGLGAAQPAEEYGLPLHDSVGLEAASAPVDSIQVAIGSNLATIRGASVVEGNQDPHDATFSVSLQWPSDGLVSLYYTTVDGTATAGSDYIDRQGVLYFPLAAKEGLVRITIQPDYCSEPDERFYLRLYHLTTNSPALGQVYTSIQNDDGTNATPVLRIQSFTRQSTGWRVVFGSACNRRYRLYRTERMIADPWQPVGAAVDGTGRLLTLEDLTPPSRAAYYRIQVEPGTN